MVAFGSGCSSVSVGLSLPRFVFFLCELCRALALNLMRGCILAECQLAW